ncbi:MAG TPA: hypothetical protein VKZ43_10445, partial [Trueperaceae bacterium]|nr:hypothetical protein [Trueperaceae bacterium]
DASGNLYTSGSQSSSGVIRQFQFDVESGMTFIGAWSDENENGEVDDGDFLGKSDQWVYVPPNKFVAGLNVVVVPVVGQPTVPVTVRDALEAAVDR